MSRGCRGGGDNPSLNIKIKLSKVKLFKEYPIKNLNSNPNAAKNQLKR